MRALLFSLLLACPAMARELIVAVGADGDPAYTPIFKKEADEWIAAGKKAGFNIHTVGLDEKATPRTELQDAIEALPPDGDDVWLVLIGHGSFDGRSAKFNLRGDDVSSAELATWLDPLRRRLVMWNLFSTSGAFLSDLSRANRVIVSATRGGTEQNYSRFGEKVSDLLSGKEADLDGDGVVSVVELMAMGTVNTRAFYENEQRLLSEHAVLDDNGDGAGAESDLLLHPKPIPGRVPDGKVASEISMARNDSTPTLTDAQTQQRDAIEKRIADLRAQKDQMSETLYFSKLESLMLEMVHVYQSARGGRQAE